MPDHLYHYTSQKGFMGIASSRSVHATHIQYLNDQLEFLGTWRVLDELETEINDRSVTGFLANLRRPQRSLYNVCVFSFSECGDQLSQWRGYCRPGDGYSLGYPFDYVQRVANEQEWQLVKCAYDAQTQKAEIRELLDHHVATYVEAYATGGPTSDALQDVIDDFTLSIIRLAPRYKDPSFDEEQESRLVSPPKAVDQLQFRQGKHTLIPFCELALPDLHVVRLRIIVGPSTHMKLAVNSARSLLLAGELLQGAVEPSKVALRDW